MGRCGTSDFNEVNGILSHFSSFIYVSYSRKIWKKTRKIVFPVPSWANKISLRDAPAHPENGGAYYAEYSNHIALAGYCVRVCVCARVCVLKKNFSEKWLLDGWTNGLMDTWMDRPTYEQTFKPSKQQIQLLRHKYASKMTAASALPVFV